MNAQPLSADARRHFESRFQAWRRNGTSTRAANVLALSGCDTAEEVAQLGRRYFEKLPNCAEKTLAELSEIGNWPPRRSTVADIIATALSLGLGAEESREAAIDVLSSLRCAGFAIVATRRGEART